MGPPFCQRECLEQNAWGVSGYAPAQGGCWVSVRNGVGMSDAAPLSVCYYGLDFCHLLPVISHKGLSFS